MDGSALRLSQIRLSNSPSIVIPGRRVSAGPGIQSHTPCLHLWIPGSRFRAPRNDERVGARRRPYSWRRRVRRSPFLPPRMPRGWSAGWRTSLKSCRTSCDVRAPAGAPSRRFLFPGSAFPGTRHLRQSLVQPAPGRRVLVPPDRLPRRPGCGVTNPARGRRANRRFPASPSRPMPHLRHRASSWLHRRTSRDDALGRARRAGH